MKMAVGEEYKESDRLLRSSDISCDNAEQEADRDLEQQQQQQQQPQPPGHSHSDDRGFSYSARRLTIIPRVRDRVVLSTLDPPPPQSSTSHRNDELRDSSPPEWALLLLGCLLGLATGLFVAAFNRGVFHIMLYLSSLINHIHPPAFV